MYLSQAEQDKFVLQVLKEKKKWVFFRNWFESSSKYK